MESITVEINNLQVMLKKIKFKYSKKLISNTLTYKVSLTLNLIITFFCLILVLLYVIGNYQNFQDKSQQIILKVLSYTSIFNTMLSVLLAIESLIKIFTENHKVKSILNTIFLILTIIFCIFCIEISSVITYLSMGIK